jgi:DNA-directed RNA polymerase I, II, and III subunit RPABC1
VQKANDTTDQLIVFFPEDHSVGIKPIRRFVEKMTEQNVKHGILVIRNALTPSANKVPLSALARSLPRQIF